MEMSIDGTSSTSKLLAVAAASATASSLVTYAVFKWYQNKESSRELAPLGIATPCRNGFLQSAEESSYQPTPQLSNGPQTAPRDPFDPRPRTGYLSWDDYFMAVAFLSAQRSKDPAKQVGACIVNQNRVICGIGYNGFPRGCPDRKLPWAKKSRNSDPLETKYPYVCHAEMNAILNKNGASVEGATVYVTMFPCNECAKLLIQAGVAEIVFHEDKAQPRSETPGAFKLSQQYAASKKLLTLSGVHVRQHLFQRPVTLSLSNHPSCPILTNPVNGISESRLIDSQYSTDMVESELESVAIASAMDSGSAIKGEAAAAAAAAAAATSTGVANDGASEVDPALEAVLKLWREKSEDGDVDDAGQQQQSPSTKTLRFEDV